MHKYTKQGIKITPYEFLGHKVFVDVSIRFC
nr:MAG TPA: hypothetical protein [Caudoviricetes sp.]DAT80457.1 MAG TPA: hypothetical protein [Bacteriophage sp.]DAU56959.1 MAG TPA: hypothetical protein [Caudoviricetes sp.]